MTKIPEHPNALLVSGLSGMLTYDTHAELSRIRTECEANGVRCGSLFEPPQDTEVNVDTSPLLRRGIHDYADGNREFVAGFDVVIIANAATENILKPDSVPSQYWPVRFSIGWLAGSFIEMASKVYGGSDRVFVSQEMPHLGELGTDKSRVNSVRYARARLKRIGKLAPVALRGGLDLMISTAKDIAEARK